MVSRFCPCTFEPPLGFQNMLNLNIHEKNIDFLINPQIAGPKTTFTPISGVIPLRNAKILIFSETPDPVGPIKSLVTPPKKNSAIANFASLRYLRKKFAIFRYFSLFFRFRFASLFFRKFVFASLRFRYLLLAEIYMPEQE